MSLFFIYSIKVALCLTMFYLLYKLLLSRETFHCFNRAVLLALPVVSLVLPLVHISAGGASQVAGGFIVVEDAIVQVVTAGDAGRSVSFVQLCFLIYIIGVAFFLCREIWSLASLSRMIRRGRVAECTYDGVRIIVVDGDTSPFSWFGNIVVCEKDYAHNSRFILAHERAHVASRHSVDVLLCDMLIIFQWYNPAAWLLKAELQNIHEYEADSAVLAEGVDASDYQLLLIRKAVGDKLFSMANNLNQSSLKKRIAMMLKKKSNPWLRARVLLAAPVAAVAVVAFATPKAENLSKEIKAESDALVKAVMPAVGSLPSDVHIAEASPSSLLPSSGVDMAGLSAVSDATDPAPATSAVPDDDDAYDVVEVMPEFPGGQMAMMRFVSDHIRYPEAAVKAQIEGRVIVQFVVDATGSVCKPEILRGVNPELDAEALRVVGEMPKWTPGKQYGKNVSVKFTMPITFRLTDAGDVASANAAQPSTIKLSGRPSSLNFAPGSTPYIIVDGKHVDSFNDIKAADIESIEVFKDKANTVDKYGEAAKDGVVSITLRK